MQNHRYCPLFIHCIIDSMPAELLPNFSDKPSAPRSDWAPSAATAPVLSEPEESSVNTQQDGSKSTVVDQTKQQGVSDFTVKIMEILLHRV